jgi:hypothetical protein
VTNEGHITAVVNPRLNSVIEGTPSGRRISRDNNLGDIAFIVCPENADPHAGVILPRDVHALTRAHKTWERKIAPVINRRLKENALKLPKVRSRRNKGDYDGVTLRVACE